VAGVRAVWEGPHRRVMPLDRILVRRVLKRGNFASLDALRDRLPSFVAYFS